MLCLISPFLSSQHIPWGIDNTFAATKISGKGRVEGDAKKAIAETLDAQVAELKDSEPTPSKGKGKGGRPKPPRNPAVKKEKTQDQIDLKDLQKDCKSFPGLDWTWTLETLFLGFLN